MLQLQETECGAVALGIVLAHHGRWVPAPELRRRCDVGVHGVNAMALVRAAQAFGLEARALRVPVDGLRSLPAPVILYWQQRHFLVLEGVAGDRAWLNDPAEGRRTVSIDELRAGYSGVALVLEPGPAFQPCGAPPHSRNALVVAIAPGRAWLLVLAALAALEMVALATAVRALGDLIDVPPSGWSVVVAALVALTALRGGQVALVDRAIEAIARPAQRALLNDLRHVPTAFLAMRRPETLGGRLRLAEVPGTVAVQVGTSGVRAMVGLPLMLGLAAWASLWAALALGGLLGLVVLSTWWFRSDDGDDGRAAMRVTGQTMALMRHGHAIRTGGEEANALSEALRHPTPASAPSVRMRGVIVVQAVALTVPAMVAASVASNGAGDVVVVALSSLLALRLVAVVGGIIGAVAGLPGVVAQLRDSAEERDWSERETAA